jgi:RNA polymerase sigma-70 factor (ECF subfamily)
LVNELATSQSSGSSDADSDSPERESPRLSEADLDRYRGWIRLLAEAQLPRAMRRRADASDIAQEVITRAWEHQDELRGDSEAEVLAWLRTILAHTIANTGRDQRRECRDVRREVPLEQRLGDASQRIGEWLAAEGSTPSHAAMRLELAQRVASALESLPSSQREAVVLRHFLGASLDEISAQLGRSPGAAALLIHRGLTRLRELLAKDAP